jgi:cytoskeletal protein CcmA (bactofilin family)
MSTFGQTISIRGEVRSSDDMIFEGRIEGPVSCEGGAIVVGPSATIAGDIVARDVTILGRVDGQIVATDVVHLREGSVVTGQVMSKRFILNDGANFVGRVEPQHLEAALRVARFHQRTRDTASPAAGQRA